MGSKSNDLDLSKFKPQPYASVEEAEQNVNKKPPLPLFRNPS